MRMIKLKRGGGGQGTCGITSNAAYPELASDVDSQLPPSFLPIEQLVSEMAKKHPDAQLLTDSPFTLIRQSTCNGCTEQRPVWPTTTRSEDHNPVQVPRACRSSSSSSSKPSSPAQLYFFAMVHADDGRTHADTIRIRSFD
ncbi:TPA: hypothetical protein N0F65_005431 [Lagenidium giganteum]|uniref:Uncharacterized protein n=1 Tax=Lagenidium giganteum TaxID=4803 RepID=A0AAV2Z1S9_9STRA|nr:TPA: hypothetical protein N0F65_005431 [Lagenidium giganteum]